MTYTTLLPARMGRLELRNRIVFPAMVTNYCSTRGEVTDRLWPTTRKGPKAVPVS